MENKLGVFICSGYGIGEALDLEALEKVAKDEYKVPHCQTLVSCEGDDLAQIIAEVKGEELNRVIIAGYSARATIDALQMGDDIIFEHVNLREQVIWSHPPNDEDTQMMAEDYLRMAIAKMKRVEKLTIFEQAAEVDKTVLVIGGGVAGLTAAQDSAKAGYPVVLVEQAAELGGWMAKQHQVAPMSAPFAEPQDSPIKPLIEAVESHELITVYKSMKVAGISGGPGLYDVTFKSLNGADAPAEKRVGAVVLSTGWKPVEPTGVDHLGYGQLPDVITNVQFEEMACNGGIKRPSNGQPAKSVVFLQTEGSATREQFSYASAIISVTSLKQALYVREQGDDAKAFIFYDNFLTPGHYENFYRQTQENTGVFLSKGTVSGVAESDGQLKVTVSDSLLGEQNIAVMADLVVVACGMEPNAADGDKIRQLIDSKWIVENGDSEQLKKDAAERVEELKHLEGTEILNLNYRQGPDLPALVHGYPDSHFICFPYETRRTGIYAAGCVRSPMDGMESIEDGCGAALKAIQCVEMTSRGEAVHPRSGDRSFPDFNLSRCTQCKRCTEECPFGVLNEDEKGTPEPNPTRCRRCGVCLGACPERIVSFKDYAIELVNDMIKAVEVPDEFEEKPRVLVLACENDAYPALDMAGKLNKQYSAFIRVIPLRCIGSMNVTWISTALSQGFDGILLFGCKYGDDYQCHFIKGSELADCRGENIREKLTTMALENERVQLHQVEITDHAKMVDTINEFMEFIEEVGMNPFKGM